MPLRQRLENLPVGQKLLAALLVLLTTVLLVANLTFISAAYYISQESMAPQALQTIGRLVSNPSLVADALQSPQNAERLRKAIVATLEAKDSLTPDLGGGGTTLSFAKAIASRL